MTIPFLSFAPQHTPIREEVLAAVAGVYDSHWYVLGSAVEQFEREYAAFNQVGYCVGVANGLDALHLALRALGVGEGDEVIVPSNTYIATWLAASFVGAKPVPVEPDPLTYNLDPARVPPASFLIAEPSVAAFNAEAPIDLTAQQVYEVAAISRPELRAADLRLQAALKGVDVARGNYYPRLSFGAALYSGFSNQRSSFIPNGDTVLRPVGFLYDLTTQQPIYAAPVVTFQPGGTFSPTNFTSQLNDNFGKQLSFNLNIPILNSLQVRTQVARAQLQAQQAQVNTSQVRLTLRQDIERAVTSAEAARRRYAAAARQLQALDLSLRNADVRFQNGLLNATDFNQIKNNRARAEADQIQAKYDFVFKRKVLDLYMGKPLEL